MKDLPTDPRKLTDLLQRWFSGHARDLPWRHDRTAYRVWLSEVMLQQTRVKTVIPYFDRFTTRFPSLHDLAAASQDDVLSLWSGLGYYSRGRNLHRCAQTVVDQWNGEFPSTAAELERLPGIGRYTAAAIASIYFRERVPLADGNVARVLARLSDDPTPVDGAAGQRLTWSRAAHLAEVAANISKFNEGLMELGALICTPKQPRCDRCPWTSECRAKTQGTTTSLPVKLPKKARTKMRAISLVPLAKGAVWLEKRPESGLFGSLYEPPTEELGVDELPLEAACRLADERGLPLPVAATAVEVRRTLTHRELCFFVVPLVTDSARWPAKNRFESVQISRIGTSSAVRAVLASAFQSGGQYFDSGDPGL